MALSQAGMAQSSYKVLSPSEVSDFISRLKHLSHSDRTCEVLQWHRDILSGAVRFHDRESLSDYQTGLKSYGFDRYFPLLEKGVIRLDDHTPLPVEDTALGKGKKASKMVRIPIEKTRKTDIISEDKLLQFQLHFIDHNFLDTLSPWCPNFPNALLTDQEIPFARLIELRDFDHFGVIWRYANILGFVERDHHGAISAICINLSTVDKLPPTNHLGDLPIL